MKYLPLSLCAVAVMLLTGCSLFKSNVASGNSLNVPSHIDATVNGKPLERILSTAGQTFKVDKDVVTHNKDGSESRKIALKSTGLYDFLGGFGVWFLIGGLFLIAGVVAFFFLKANAFAWSSVLSGLSIIMTALFLKVFYMWIAYLVFLILVVGLVYEIILHRKKLSVAAEDIMDNGKLDGSTRTKDTPPSP